MRQDSQWQTMKIDIRDGENRQRQANKGKAEEKNKDTHRNRQIGQVETQTDRQAGRQFSQA